MELCDKKADSYQKPKAATNISQWDQGRGMGNGRNLVQHYLSIYLGKNLINFVGKITIAISKVEDDQNVKAQNLQQLCILEEALSLDYMKMEKLNSNQTCYERSQRGISGADKSLNDEVPSSKLRELP